MTLDMNNVECILQNQTPSGIVYAPNYWQWFSHHQNHGTLPDKIEHCKNQLNTGKLTEQIRYIFNESTIVQKKFLITDYAEQANLFEQFLVSRK